MCAGVASFLEAKVPVARPKASDGMADGRGGREVLEGIAAVAVVADGLFRRPLGFAGLDLSLQAGTESRVEIVVA